MAVVVLCRPSLRRVLEDVFRKKRRRLPIRAAGLDWRPMMRTLVLATAAVIAAGSLAEAVLSGSAPASAQPRSACLQNNRIWSTNVVDDRTLIVMDRSRNLFVVELSGGCVGLTDNLGPIRFRTSTSLGCLGRGDRVSFRHRAVGRNTCFVRDVHTDFTTLARAGRRSR